MLFPHFICFLTSWLFFFQMNMNSLTKSLSLDKTNKLNSLNKQHSSVLIKLLFLLIFLQYVYTYFVKSLESSFWYNHLLLNNTNIFFMNLTYITCLFIANFLKSKIILRLNLSNDFFFALISICILTPLIFYSNNIFSFIFILELNTTILFYKLISSKLWYKSNKNFKKNLNKSLYPKGYLNLVFFQYWSTFFASIFLFYFFVNIISKNGLSEFNVLNFIFSNEYSISYYDNWWFIFLTLIFIICIFIKMGLTPLHLFKLEIYKNIPMISILFYTTFYFFVYFIFFMYLYSVLLYFIFLNWWFLITIIFIIAMIFTIPLLFDVNNLKVFFAYSTIINTLNFFLLLLVLFV